jgi:hypothetical protein
MAGLLLCDWLRSIESELPGTVLSHDEQKVVSLVKELLSEADISVGDGEPLSAATLNVWAGTFDDVWVWGRNIPRGYRLLIAVTPMLAKVFRRFAHEIQKSSQMGQKDTVSRMEPPSMSFNSI